MKWFNTLFFLALFLFSSSTAVSAELPGSSSREQHCLSTAWPHEKSDLAPDPALVFGRLDNGFRYVLLRNQEPKGRVGIYLNVQAGSLHETEEQRGVAHFLEHMVFNGSTHFPPGSLVDYFQSIGMSFGGDTNAHTSFDETVYRLLLPGASREELEKGLLVMADYGRGALLSEEEIERERGVILSEKRARDSVGYQSREAGLAFTLRGTRIPERMPIGVLEVLNKVDRVTMKSFYDAWYRPEKMILVVVGDVDPLLIEPLIRDRFKGLRGEGAAPVCPDFGKVSHMATDFFYHHEPEMGSTEVTIETVWNELEESDSLALQSRQIREAAAERIVHHRLESLLEQNDIPFTKGESQSGMFLGRIGYGMISAKTDPEKWQSSLGLIEQVLRQALLYGFTEQELQRVKKEMLAELDSAVLRAATRDSHELASQLIQRLNRNKVLMSPQQEQKVLSPLIANIGVNEVHDSFQAIWNHKARLIQVAGNAGLSEKDPLLQIKKSYELATTKKVTPPQAGTDLVFPYQQLAADMSPAREQLLPEVKGERIVFANGVIVNLKQTKFQDNEVQLSADFGHGKQGEPRPGLALLAERVVNDSGTSRLAQSELDQILAGSSVKLDFKVSEASFSWKGSAVTKDLELMFQMLQARFNDPVVRENAYKKAMQGFEQMYGQMTNDVSGIMQLSGESFLAGGNTSFGLPPWQEFAALNASQVRSWVNPALLSGRLEISLVGDFDRQQVRELARTYLAPLAKRGQGEATAKQLYFPVGETLRLTVESSIDKAMLVVAWPTADFWDIERTRRLYLLSQIFSDRLRKVIREKLGATYSPQVFNHPSRIYPGYGVLRAQLIVAPDQINLLSSEVVQVASDLWKSGVTVEELERAKAPMLTSLKDMVRTNGYWLNSVLALSSRYPQQLQWPATILSGFESVTREQLSVLAREYLDPAKAARIMIVPRKQGA
ncbi:MAG: insulinase family protein [Desulfoarculaceae bacterium]|nr:insulinase family protein [Desulfoarculaceae bacterium]